MEEIDPPAGIRVPPAQNRTQQVADATLPMVVPRFVGLLLYRFDMKSRGH